MTSFKKNAIASAVVMLCSLSSAHAVEDWAGADLTVTDNQEFGSVDMGTYVLTNTGTLVANDITVDGGGLSNTGTIKANRVAIKAVTSSKPLTLDGEIIAVEEFAYYGAGHNQYTRALNANLTTQHFIIDSHLADPTKEGQVGLSIKSSETLKNVDKISIIGAVSKTGLGIGNDSPGDETVQIKAPIYLNAKDGDARIEVFKGRTLIADRIVSLEAGKAKLQTNAAGLLKVNTVEVAKGAELSIQSANGDYTDVSEFQINNIVVNDGGSLTAKAGGQWVKPIASFNANGNELKVTLGTDSTVNFGGTDFDSETPANSSKGESIKVGAESISITVDSTNPETASFILPNVEGNVVAKPENISVTATGVANTGNAQTDLSKLANVVTYSSRVGDTGELNTEVANGIHVTQQASDLYDGASAIVTQDANGNAIVDESTIKITANGNIYGIAEMNTLGLHIWRNEINDMNKRLGEIRDSKGQLNGLWARVYAGEAEIGTQNVTNEYQAVQFGYDRQVKPNIFAGAAFSYTDGDNNFAVGGGENQIYALTAYGSYISDSGLFMDLTAKYGRLDNKFDIRLADGTRSAGDYDANAFSVSAEAGWRLNATDIFFVEPQIEMMYGWVENVNYKTSTGLSVEHDKAETLIGRAGLVLGLQCPDRRGNAYVRASVLHDFKGEADYSFSKNGDTRHLSDDLGGTWYEYGIGANFNVTPQTHVYADLEAANGGEVDTDYRVNVGVRYSF